MTIYLKNTYSFLWYLAISRNKANIEFYNYFVVTFRTVLDPVGIKLAHLV